MRKMVDGIFIVSVVVTIIYMLIFKETPANWFLLIVIISFFTSLIARIFKSNTSEKK